MALNKTTTVAVIAIVIVALVAVVFFNPGEEEVKSVTYEGNGGKDSDGATTLKYVNEVVLPNHFTYDDYKFVCYNTKADGSGDMYHVGDKVSLGTTLYAQWDTTTYHSIFMSYSDNTSNSGPTFYYSPDGGTRVTPLAGASFYGLTDKSVILTLEGTEWSLNEETKTFTGKHNDKVYDITIIVKHSDGTEDQSIYRLMDHNGKKLPGVKVIADCDITIRYVVSYAQ